MPYMTTATSITIAPLAARIRAAEEALRPVRTEPVAPLPYPSYRLAAEAANGTDGRPLLTALLTAPTRTPMHKPAQQPDRA
jgi:hypothetical protein